MYKVGIIGLGHIASAYGGAYTHVGGIFESDKVELAAVADISPEAHDKFMEQWGDRFAETRHYNGYADMFAAEALDIIAVCTRGPHHYTAMLDGFMAANHRSTGASPVVAPACQTSAPCLQRSGG